MGRPAAPDYWRRWRAAHPAYRERERERGQARRRAGYRSPKTRRARVVAEPVAVAPHPLLAWAQELAGRPRPRGPSRPPLRRALPRRRRREVLLGTARATGPGRTSHRLAADTSAPGATTSRRCSRSAERWMARSRVCACRGCERHTGACGWPTTNERRCDRCGRPGFANRFRRTPDHPVRRTSAWRRLAKRTVEAWVARHGWSCPGWHRAAASGAARRARGRPSGAARPRRRAAACAARRPLRELQRAQGVESAAAVTTAQGATAETVVPSGYSARGANPRSMRTWAIASLPLSEGCV